MKAISRELEKVKASIVETDEHGPRAFSLNLTDVKSRRERNAALWAESGIIALKRP